MGSTRRGGSWYAASMPHAPGFLRLVEAARQRTRGCSVLDVKRLLDAGKRFHLIDVREHEEWTKGHLPRARHLCKGVIDAPRRRGDGRTRRGSARRGRAIPRRQGAARAHPLTGEGAARRRDEAGGAPQMTWCPQLIGVPQSGPTVHGDGPAPRGGHHDGQKTLACEIAKTVSRPWGGGRLRPSGKCRQSVRVPRGR